MVKNRNVLLLLCTTFGWSLITGCSSIMTHSGPHQGYYSGAKANIDMLKDDQTGWIMKPLLAVDLPFSAFLDTLLLPYDYARSSQNQAEQSPKRRIEQLEKTNNTLPESS
ncbi:YceK/YidQ family lipoprotein [Xenorhabdus nematophila]|nr:YceK/YidQ family lipoprotein [Xenorhabdus nematophila]AYA42541.1 YceK/YidQ family lipoprotein [Xenorhabdus nematophila]KHD29683.1 membrane protein [Xenorhabdus nematophila]MBA0020572.1 YceK/YidQ family lipoprotein [Xenorhabdus nematophila]MCB4424643.1 YceK/YidQ family lipoprotein [Xenorhabdus nematophila]QNJ36214.1 YceK/YidQ family lipoprotein [Xenorhabdus nematophila]